MIKIVAHAEDTYNEELICGIQKVKDSICKELNVVTEMINEISTELNSKKQSFMLMRIISLHFNEYEEKVYRRISNVQSIHENLS